MIVLRNLLRNKLTSLLTILGVAAGVSVFVSSLTVAEGLRREVQAVLINYNVDIIVQSKGAATPTSSVIYPRDAAGLAELPSVHEVACAPDLPRARHSTARLALATAFLPW